jgi:leucine dehydrogenase
MIFDTIAHTGHEEVVFCHNQDAGLKAIIAIHNSVLGPALGGLRMWNYATEQDALNDVLRLSRGMTYKAAVSGLNLGGGKAVIIGDPSKDKTEALFRAFGRFVNSLNGRYITAEDVGIDVNDMEYVFRETEFVTGVHQVHGGSGDPSPFTAYGTLQGLMAALQVKFGNEDVGKYAYAVQGVGHVGMEFVKLLRERGAKVFVTDINKELVQKAVDDHGAEAVAADQIYDVDAEVYSPCALGGTVIPSRPSAPSFGHRSAGKRLSWSICAARGAISASAKRRTASRNASSSSPSGKTRSSLTGRYGPRSAAPSRPGAAGAACRSR